MSPTARCLHTDHQQPFNRSLLTMHVLTATLLSMARKNSENNLRRCVRNASLFTIRRGKGRPRRSPEQKPERKPSVPNIEILRQLKKPIAESKKLITELEVLLINHEKTRARDLTEFNDKLADQFDRFEPQRKWYYDKLGIVDEQEDTKSSNEPPT